MKRVILFSIILAIIPAISFSKESKKQAAVRMAIEKTFNEMKKNFEAIPEDSPNELVFQKVFQAENKNKEDIFNAAIEILARIYGNSNFAIQSRDKEDGIIIGKGHIDSEPRKVNFATTFINRCHNLTRIEAKDNRYRITITLSDVDLIVNNTNSIPCKPYDFYPYWKDCKPKNYLLSFNNLRSSYELMISLLDGLGNAINEKLKENDNW